MVQNRGRAIPPASKIRGFKMIRSNLSDFAFLFSGMLLIMAIPVCAGLLSNGFIDLAFGVFFVAGLLNICSLVAMFLSVDRS